MGKKLFAANWKENPQSERDAVRIFSGICESNPAAGAETIICPPFVYLPTISKLFKTKTCKLKAKLGAQDVFWEDAGAFTGEISAPMIRGFGAEYVIIGHSERRKWLGETDETINKKVAAALKAGLKVILCVGEPLEVRRKGLPAAKHFIENQLQKDLKKIRNPKSEIRNLLVAYEPAWAIGSGRPDKPRNALEMIKYIKKILRAKLQIPNFRVLYGGSVNSRNIKNFLKYDEIDGALVGGASLKVGEFRKMLGAIVNK